MAAVGATPAALWQVIEGIGGATGWYSFPAAWAVRGLLDRLAGGVGLRRGRRDPHHLRVGDALDFWRVEAITPGRLLRLRAEMKLPGLAWLELTVGPRPTTGLTTYSQRAIFQPRGLAGHAYWRSISPFHGLVFGGMVRNITRAAEQADRPEGEDGAMSHTIYQSADVDGVSVFYREAGPPDGPSSCCCTASRPPRGCGSRC